MVYPAGEYEIVTFDPSAVAVAREKLNGKKRYLDGACIEVWEDGGRDLQGNVRPIILVQIWEDGSVADCLKALSEMGLAGYKMEVYNLDGELLDSPVIEGEKPFFPDNVEVLENIHGDIAAIYYFDGDCNSCDCYGWQIFQNGEKPLGMHDCRDADKAYAILSRNGFRY